MPLIDGVGDEVVQFVCVVLLVVVAALAWWSTNARPDRYRTVLVMRSRHHPVTLSITTRQGPNLRLTSPNNSALQPSTSTSDSSGSTMAESNEETPRESTRVIPLQEMDSIVDADMAMLNHNRLHFYRRVDFLWLHTVQGKETLLIDDYRFCFSGAYQTTQCWKCTNSKGKKCKARVIMTQEREIVRAVVQHNHPPAKYMIRNGVYIKF